MSSEQQKIDKIIKGKAKILTHDKCDVCPDTLGFLGKQDNFEIPVENTEIKYTTDEGKKWIDEKKLADAEGNIKTPAIVKCDVYESGKEDCKEIVGFNEGDFANWRKKQQQEQQQQNQADGNTTNPSTPPAG